MSQYDDDNEIELNDYEPQHQKQIFHYDTSLLTSVQTLNTWKQNTGLSVLEYLKKQEQAFHKQYYLFSSGKQIRAIAFCQMLARGFQELSQKYTNAYAKVKQEGYDIVGAVRQLDSELEQLVRHLQMVEANNLISIETQVEKYQQCIPELYSNLRKVCDFCLNLKTLWLTLLTPRMFRQQQKQSLYKINYGGTQLYYHKQLSYLVERVKRAEIYDFDMQPKSQESLLTNMGLILSSTKLKENLKTKIVSLLKGQYYNRMDKKSLKEQFIIASLEMYNGDQTAEVWDYEGYENVCVRALKAAFLDDQYMDCVLYMQPENIHFQHRKRTLQLAQIYYTLIWKILSLNKNPENPQLGQKEAPIALVQIPQKFIHRLLHGQNIQLLGHLLVNFLMSNKNAFSQSSPSLDSLLFGILEGMRQLYLSFGGHYWQVPTAALAALTNKFFTKFSEDIKEEIVGLLPAMVKSLGEDRLPLRPVVTEIEREGGKDYQLEIKEVSRSEMLMAIFLYIRDAEYKDQDFYLDLPQVTPTNLQTAIMFMRSLQLKLRHHEPTEDQKKLWTMIIDESSRSYKIYTSLKWYKPKKKLDIEEREGEFNIHKQIKDKWAFELVQDVLNHRDQQIFEKLIEDGTYRQLNLENQIIGYFKYAIELNLEVSRVSSNIEEYELFSFLDKMKTLLDINYGDVVHLTIDELITINELHLSLKIYNTRVQYAKGNEIYMLIVTKIIIPWMESEDKAACQSFKKKFPQFFTRYIMQEYYLIIGDSLVTLLANRSENAQNLLYKINYFLQQLNRDDLASNSLDNNAELLQKLYSVLDDSIDVNVMVSIMLLLLKFLEYQPKLEDEYVSLGFFVDFICQPKRIDLFLKKIEELAQNQRLRINIQIIKKLPEKLQLLTLAQINQILRTHIDSDNDNNDPQKFLKILETIPKEKNTLLVVILRALTAERNKHKVIDAIPVDPEQEAKGLQLRKEVEEKTFRYWKQVEDYVASNMIERKKGEEEVYLAKIAELFEDTVFKKLLEDYRKILHTQNKKKMSSKKTSVDKKFSEAEKKQSEAEKKESVGEIKQPQEGKKQSEGEKKIEQIKQKQTEKQISIEDKYKQAKIWRKVVRNFGTFEDIILFGEDPLQIYGNQEQQIFDKCLKIISQKSIQQKHLKRIIRKLPILQKCSQNLVQKLQKEEKQKHVQPELLCKLIMINSRYRSKIVEQFILENISKIPIPVKIYQDYLVLDIKRKLQHLPRNLINEMLFENISLNSMKKVDEVFQLITYLPIKKFQNVFLKFETKIEENQEGENEEWETESEGRKGEEQEQDQDQEQEESSPKQKKKKQSKVSNDDSEQTAMKNNTNPLEDIEHENGDGEGGSEEIDDDDDEEIDDGESMQDEDIEPPHSKIVDMFYTENDPNLPRYKNFITLREEINISFEQNYLSEAKLQAKIKADPELQKKLLKTVDILENQISQPQIVQQILNKTPLNLYKILQNYGLTKKRNQQKVQNYRKQMTRMQSFLKDSISDRDENEYQNEQDNEIDDDIYDEQDELSEQTNSVDDMFDGLGDNMMFVINEEGQLQHFNVEEFKDEEDDEDDRESEEIKVVENLEKEADDSLSLPQLKQINSKIELQLTGKQLVSQDIAKILQISILKLFSLHSYQLKYKPVYSFYTELLNSKHGKIFLDTLFTVLRVDELYDDDQRYNLAKKLSKSELSISKALANILEIAVDLASQDSKEGKLFETVLLGDVGALLPIADEIMVKSDIPIQDNFLTLLVMYSRYHQSQHIRKKLKDTLTNLVEPEKGYKLTKSKSIVLTKHIYKNSNSSTIWSNIQQRFNVEIDYKIKSYSCLSIYGQLLREDVEKCYQDLLEIVKISFQFTNQEEKKKARLMIKQQEKKVEQNIRKHFKRIKHYYYWNKKLLTEFDEIEKQEDKLNNLLKNKPLIKLTELMIFYCHFLKQKFFKKIDANSMKNLLVLPKSVIEISFLYLWKMQAKIDKWEPLNKVKLYFQNFKLYQHKFTTLESVSNLVLQFLQMPQFSNSKFKQVIIPYLIANPEMANDIPLIFKLPDIPEELNGQKVYLTRQCSFDMSFYQLVAKSILVEFHNEEGSDHGGMVREFMMGWTGAGIGEEFVFLGKILAISFRKSIPFGGDFDMPMAIALTQHKVTIEFIAQFEPEVAKSLVYVRDNDPEDLEMRFEITRQKNGVIKHYPLIENGEEIAVTNENKAQFLQLFLSKYFIIDREWEMSELCTGFFSIINKKYAAIFNPFELIQKIQGEQISDYTKLKNKTKYEQGYTESSQMIKWFWQIVSQFNQPQMNKFLQFITGAPKVSIYNHNFSFVIEKPYGEDETRLPVAHTCFNTLELPEYKTKQILQKKLTQAIYEGNDNFGIL